MTSQNAPGGLDPVVLAEPGDIGALVAAIERQTAAIDRLRQLVAEWAPVSPDQGQGIHPPESSTALVTSHPVLVALPDGIDHLDTEAGWIREVHYFEADPIPYRYGTWHLASVHVSTFKDSTTHRPRCSTRITLDEREGSGYRSSGPVRVQSAVPGPDDEVCGKCREIAAGRRKPLL